MFTNSKRKKQKRRDFVKPNYSNLKFFLENGADIQPYSFKQIEFIIGVKLPETCKIKKAIESDDFEIRKTAEEAGFYIEKIDYDHSWIIFSRLISVIIDGVERKMRKTETNELNKPKTISSDDIGKDLDKAIGYFKESWSSVGGEYVPFCDKYDNLGDVYFNAGMEAYRAAMKRAIKFHGLNQRTRNQLRIESCEYLANRFTMLFGQTNLDFASFSDWAKETTKHIRGIYRDAGVNDYTIGNAQKIVNVAIKFVMSSNIVDYKSDVFKYCHLPVDSRIQEIIKKTFRIKPLRTCWSKNDNWRDFVDYQIRVRNAVLEKGYYSPMVWEATHWR